MAVYYKLKSEKDYFTLPIECPFVSVGDFKSRIFNSKRYGKGKDFDLIVTNAQTNEEYVDESALIPKNTSVLIRRIPHPLLKPIIPEEPKVIAEATQSNGISDTDSFAEKQPGEPDWDFGQDIFSEPKEVSDQTNKLDEDRKIEALVNTPSLYYQSQTKDANVSSVRALSGRMTFSSCNAIFGFKKPPPGYTCHRCKVPGHLIQQCPTNGDPNFDVKKLKRATGIPKSMLLVTRDGSYSLPSGDTAILQPNESAFAKEIEGIPSVHYASDLPPELNCPLCNQVMKDAVMSSKCCFSSFCDKCIRDHIISKFMCNCGATNILADDLIPNLTLRDTINSIMVQNSSSENPRSSITYEGSKNHVEPVPQASACAVASTIENDSHTTVEPSKVKGGYGRKEMVNNSVTKSAEKTKKENADKLKALPEETSMKKSASKRHASFDQEHQGKMADGAEGKKKKKLKCSDRNDAQLTNMAFQDPFAMYYGGGSSFIPTCYAYFGFAGYEATSAAGIPYLSYAPSACDDAVGGGGILQDLYGQPVYPFNAQRDWNLAGEMKTAAASKRSVSSPTTSTSSSIRTGRRR